MTHSQLTALAYIACMILIPALITVIILPIVERLEKNKEWPDQ